MYFDWNITTEITALFWQALQVKIFMLKPVETFSDHAIYYFTELYIIQKKFKWYLTTI